MKIYSSNWMNVVHLSFKLPAEANWPIERTIFREILNLTKTNIASNSEPRRLSKLQPRRFATFEHELNGQTQRFQQTSIARPRTHSLSASVCRSRRPLHDLLHPLLLRALPRSGLVRLAFRSNSS